MGAVMYTIHIYGQAHRQMTRRIYTKSFKVIISGEEAGSAYGGIGEC